MSLNAILLVHISIEAVGGWPNSGGDWMGGGETSTKLANVAFPTYYTREDWLTPPSFIPQC